MIRANMHEAKSNLSKLVERALAGERVEIARDGEPVVVLTPIAVAAQAERPLGLFAGQVWIAEDFAEPDLEAEAAAAGELERVSW